MSEGTLIQRATVTFDLRCKSPLHVGATGYSLDLGIMDSAEPKQVVRGSGGVPYISGSTLRGWMRNLVQLACSNEGFSEDLNKGKPVADFLFGASATQVDRGKSGCVDVGAYSGPS